MSQEITPARIVETMLAFAPAKVLLTAVEIGIFTELAERSLDLQTLTERLGLHPRAARDYFDALVALHFLERHDGLYSNAPETDLFLDRNKPSYIGGFLDMMNMRSYSMWGSLTESLRTGKPQNTAMAEGSDEVFESIYNNPVIMRNFLSGMTGISRPVAMAIATKFPWHKYQTFLDVGTAQGDCPVQIAQIHNHITGGGFDLPSVQPYFEEHIAQYNLQDRLRFFAGNFFEVALPGADVLIMGQILHDWNLQQRQQLVKKAYDALPQGGALIVYDMIIDEERREEAIALLASLSMLLETPGGAGYTAAECMSWMRAAGFTEMNVERLGGGFSMVVGVK